MTAAAGAGPARGAPLAMMAVLLAGWIGARALVWESPFAPAQALLPAALAPLADSASPGSAQVGSARVGAFVPSGEATRAGPVVDQGPLRAGPAGSDGRRMLPGSGLAPPLEPRLAAAHQLLWRAGMRTVLVPAPGPAALASGTGGDDRLPFLPPATSPATLPPPASATGRWSLDTWGFWRQGSDAAPISQGRVPIYGASQVGALLQYRLAPASRRDPRLYARAYRALVRRGETELALGASARPLPQVPVRLYGEMRLTEGAFRTETRPAAFAVTEIAPVALPLGTRLETYAQAGWVGGIDDTVFADGQASLTRDIPALARLSGDRLRVSLGAGAWGGAQEDAHRVDIGPTMRLDLAIGEVPARVSLDWRERVEGDAGPDSGLAVTLATSF